MAEIDDKELAALQAKAKEADTEIEKWKALSRKNEDRAKENADAADELKKLKEVSLSDQQKREAAEKANADKLAELEKRANEADARALRAEVASVKGLSETQAKRLTGSTREELEADADDLLSSFKPTEGSKPAGKPTESLNGGGDPTGDPTPDMRKVVADIPRGF